MVDHSPLVISLGLPGDEEPVSLTSGTRSLWSVLSTLEKMNQKCKLFMLTLQCVCRRQRGTKINLKYFRAPVNLTF